MWCLLYKFWKWKRKLSLTRTVRYSEVVQFHVAFYLSHAFCKPWWKCKCITFLYLESRYLPRDTQPNIDPLKANFKDCSPRRALRCKTNRAFEGKCTLKEYFIAFFALSHNSDFRSDGRRKWKGWNKVLGVILNWWCYIYGVTWTVSLKFLTACLWMTSVNFLKWNDIVYRQNRHIYYDLNCFVSPRARRCMNYVHA